jgi:small conductance mechanosensitive channel
VGFDEDIDRAIAILNDLVANEERVLKYPEPSIFVGQWADSWVEIEVRPWARNQHWWDMYTDLPRLVALRFQEEGIEIPSPRVAMTGLPDDHPTPTEDS